MATLTNKLWGIGVFGAALLYGGSVMLGRIPGMASGVGTFERIAALTATVAEKHGHVFTGLGVVLLGGVLAILCLIGGGGSPDAGWSDGDGGGD